MERTPELEYFVDKRIRQGAATYTEIRGPASSMAMISRMYWPKS